jgi:predicted enzyme related to lactoylglutathione lyase
MFSRIRHIAVYTENYARMFAFYQTVFGMRKITSGMTDEKGEYDPERGHLSDGVMGFALLQRHAGIRSGLDHFGFEVQDIETVLGRIRKDYPEVRIATSLEHVPFSVMRTQDPAGTHIDVSQKGVTKVREGYLEEGWDQPRHLHHIAIRAADPRRVAEFYRKVFELEPLEAASGSGDLCVTDGKVCLVIRPCEPTSYRAMTEGLDHFGFKVEDLESAKRAIEDLARSRPECAPKKIDVGRFGKVTQKELDSCILGKYGLADPDGVLLHLSDAPAAGA